MPDSSTIWRQAAALFDEVVALSPAERREILAQRDIPADVRAWLDELLAAHDADRTTIIDEKIDRLVEGLIAGQQSIPDHEELLGQRFGPWRATREIGHGGMGIVLAGERADGEFEMDVAIKLLDPVAFGPSLSELFRREVRILADLSHPGVAQLLDGGMTDDGLPYLVMELVDGRPLDVYCRHTEPDLDTRLDLFRQVADAVAYCHRHLIVHGDIKPGNVLVNDDGLVKLVDFGIAARLAGEDRPGESGTRIRWCSPGYAAPERLEGAAATVAEDVFALGALLYQLLTGSRIRSAAEITRLVRGEPPSEPVEPASQRALQLGLSGRIVRRLTGDLDAVVGRALAEDPRARYATVEALVDDLNRWRWSHPVSARRGGRLYELGCWFRRHRVAAGAGLIAVIALVAGTGVAVWQAEIAHSQHQRAEQALTETRQSLRRVTTLREFIVELFASVEPTQPRDELPTTRDILQSGARQAMEDEQLSDGERFELLLTLGRIHESLRLREQAQTLLEEAVGLAREHAGLGAVDLSQVLYRLAWTVGGRGDLERARELLQEAASQAARAGDPGRELRAASSHAFLMYAQGDADAAWRQLVPLQRRLEAMTDPDPKVVYAVMNVAGVVLGGTGDLEQAAAALRQAAAAAEQAYGRGSSRHTMTLSNLSNAMIRVGRFSEAEDGLRRVIAQYERLYGDRPTETRGASLNNLGRLQARMGRFSQALETTRQGSAMWARSLTLEPEAWDGLHMNLGWVHLRARRPEEALSRLTRAAEVLRDTEQVNETTFARVLNLQALVQCRLHRVRQGRQLLEQVRTMMPDGFQALGFEAERLEAVAACQLAGERFDDALATIDEARSMLRPGWILQHTELSVMAARSLHALGRTERARAELETARGRLESLDLPAGHPAFRWLSGAEAGPGADGKS